MTAQNAPESTETFPAVQTADGSSVAVNAGERPKQPCRGCAERTAVYDGQLGDLAGHVDDLEVQMIGWAGFVIGVALAAAAVAVWALLRVSAISREGDE